MEHLLTAMDMLRMAGGIEYSRGLYGAIEGLAGRPKVKGNTVLGRVFFNCRTRLQLVPPFDSRCSCARGRACRHVVTLGLTFLHQERRRTGAASWPADEACFFAVAHLQEQTGRDLVLELLATLPGATDVAADFLAKAKAAEVAEWESASWDRDNSCW